MVYSTRRFVALFILFLFFFSPFSIAITSLGEERANLSAFRTFVRYALVWFCLCPHPLGVWEGLWFVIAALPGLFSYLFLTVVKQKQRKKRKKDNRNARVRGRNGKLSHDLVLSWVEIY